VGGGIRPDNAARFLEAGASHVIVTSYVFQDGRLNEENLARLVTTVGADRVVLDLSCRRVGGHYRVATDRWQRTSELVICAETLERLGRSAGEFLVHAVDVEGMSTGVDEELIALLAAGSPLPTTYAGGVRSREDLEAVRRAGRNRIDVTVGTALDIFGGPLRYRDVVAFCRKSDNELS
jgi:phosphoribosylformimino-5-aminoimidazole carboxamide ribotide isomerase